MEESVKLIMTNGTEFEVDVKKISKCKTIATVIEETGIENPIPITEIEDNIMKKIIEYTKQEEINSIEIYPPNELKKMIMATNKLEYIELYDKLITQFANILKQNKRYQIRAIFNVEDDLTKEEKETIEKEISEMRE